MNKIEIKLGNVCSYSAHLAFDHEGVRVALGGGCRSDENYRVCCVDIQDLNVYIVSNNEFNDQTRLILKNKSHYKTKAAAIYRLASAELGKYLATGNNLARYIQEIERRGFELGAESVRAEMRKLIGVHLP